MVNNQKKIISFIIFSSLSLYADEQQSKNACVAALIKSTACEVGQRSLESCKGCKPSLQILKECIQNGAFNSETELKQAAIKEVQDKKDSALVGLALVDQKDAKVRYECCSRCTQRLVQAKESQMKNVQECDGVSTPEQVIAECKPYFYHKYWGLYNAWDQYKHAKEYAANQNNTELVLALKKDEDDALLKARCKLGLIPAIVVAFFSFLSTISNSSSSGQNWK